MTSPLKVKLSHRRDKVHSERGRNRGVKGERSVEITNRSSRRVLRHSRVGSHHNILTTINANAVPLKIFKTETNTKMFTKILKFKANLKVYISSSTRSLRESRSRMAEKIRHYSYFQSFPQTTMILTGLDYNVNAGLGNHLVVLHP